MGCLHAVASEPGRFDAGWWSLGERRGEGKRVPFAVGSKDLAEVTQKAGAENLGHPLGSTCVLKP